MRHARQGEQKRGQTHAAQGTARNDAAAPAAPPAVPCLAFGGRVRAVLHQHTHALLFAILCGLVQRRVAILRKRRVRRRGPHGGRIAACGHKRRRVGVSSTR